MPGKYSYNAVLSDYSSQGLIPLPNDKQIDYLRDASAPRASPSPANRSRIQSTSTFSLPNQIPSSSSQKRTAARDFAVEKPRAAASPSPAPISKPGGRRLLILDSDSEDEQQEASRQPSSRNLTPSAARRPPRTPTKSHRRAERPQENFRSLSRTEKPLPPEPHARNAGQSRRSTLSTPNQTRPVGVKAFIAARYNEESTVEQKAEPKAEQKADPTGGIMSLHEFLDSVPRQPEKPKRQPRDPCAVPDKPGDSLHQRDISVKEFLNLVPAPPVETPTDKIMETHDPPNENTARSSPLISRLPKGVGVRDHRSSLQVFSETGAQKLPSNSSTTRPKSAAPVSDKARRPNQQQTAREPVVSEKKTLAMSPARKLPKSSHKHAKSETSTSSAAQIAQPPQEKLGDSYVLNFEGFTDHEDSYFPPTWAGSGPTAPPKASSPRSRQSRRHEPATSRNSSRRESAGDQRLAAQSPASPRVSYPYTGSTRSTGVESATTFGLPAEAASPRKDGKQHSASASWGLPAIEPSGHQVSDFSNMFDGSDRSCDRNILIFTSDEEDEDEEEEEEDELPTPRLQRLEQDVTYPSAEWGMISAGRHVIPGAKDGDSMSDLSAVFPPDIGRFNSGGERGSPLAVALQSMQHGGELGVAYKPQSRSIFGRSLKTSEILQRLGMKRNKSEVGSIGGSVGGDSASGKSKMTAKDSKPKYHRSSSARGRLPNN